MKAKIFDLFVDFAKYYGKDFTFSKSGIHDAICGVLDNAIHRSFSSPITVINTPPRYGKSTLASVLFPLWAYDNDCSLDIGQMSSNSACAEWFSRKSLFISNEEEDPIFRFATGAALAGRNFDILIADDIAPFKSNAEATYEYLRLAMLKVTPGGRTVIIETRSAYGDITTNLRNDGFEFELLSIPALDRNGDSTFPEFWTTDSFQDFKTRFSEDIFNSEYMQKVSK